MEVYDVPHYIYIAKLKFTCIFDHHYCINKAYVYLSYIVNPLITINPVSQQVTDGEIVNFTCNATAVPAPSYSWSTPNINDFNTSTINFIASYFNFGNYTCMVTSNGTVVESQPALLTGNYVI